MGIDGHADFYMVQMTGHDLDVISRVPTHGSVMRSAVTIHLSLKLARCEDPKTVVDHCASCCHAGFSRMINVVNKKNTGVNQHDLMTILWMMHHNSL